MKILFTLDGKMVDASALSSDKFFSLLLSSLGFADDIKLIAKSTAHLQQMVEIFSFYCKAFGLRFSIPKCVCMVSHRILPSEIELRQQRQDDLIIMVEGKQIKVVTEALYLGAMEADNNDINVELSQRCKRLMASFNMWGKVTLNPHIQVEARLAILNSTVVQVGISNCQTWNHTPGDLA